MPSQKIEVTVRVAWWLRPALVSLRPVARLAAASDLTSSLFLRFVWWLAGLAMKMEVVSY